MPFKRLKGLLEHGRHQTNGRGERIDLGLPRKPSHEALRAEPSSPEAADHPRDLPKGLKNAQNGLPDCISSPAPIEKWPPLGY